jgi:hypothetical protein
VADLDRANKPLEKTLLGLTKNATKLVDTLGKIRPSPNLANLQRTLNVPLGGGASATGSNEGDAAKAEIDALNKVLKDRNDLVKAYATLVETGEIKQSAANKDLKKIYADTKKEILDAAAALEKFIQASGSKIPVQQVKLLEAELAKLKSEAKQADPAVEGLRKKFESLASETTVKFFDEAAKQLGNVITGTEKVGDAFKQLGLDVAQFFTGLLEDIAKAIIQEQVLAAIKAIGLFHTGGVVGETGGMSRSVDPSVFAFAPRYHSGAVVGIKPDEQAAILQKGEEVLTRNDPRNVLNGGKSGGKGTVVNANLRNVLVLREEDLAGAMSGSHGERVVLSHLKANLPTVRTWLNRGKT